MVKAWKWLLSSHYAYWHKERPRHSDIPSSVYSRTKPYGNLNHQKMWLSLCYTNQMPSHWENYLKPRSIHKQLQDWHPTKLAVLLNFEVITRQVTRCESSIVNTKVRTLSYTHRMKFPNNKGFWHCPCICGMANIFKVLSSISSSLLPKDLFTSWVLQFLMSLNLLLKYISYFRNGNSAFLYF